MSDHSMPAGCRHGHVFPNRDGVKARCGGLALCCECSIDDARLKRMSDHERDAIVLVRSAIDRRTQAA
jgi:hypothetical protein